MKHIHSPTVLEYTHLPAALSKDKITIGLGGCDSSGCEFGADGHAVATEVAATKPETLSRFPRNPLIIRVPFFLMFRVNKETPNKEGKRVLLGYLALQQRPVHGARAILETGSHHLWRQQICIALDNLGSQLPGLGCRVQSMNIQV